MTEQELSNAMRMHGDMVYRLALCRLQSVPDAEDVYQDVFLRYYGQQTTGWDGEHIKAWLIRCTLNRCADIGRSRSRILSLEEVPELAANPDPAAAELWDAVARLPEDFRTPIHLYYGEGIPKVCEGLRQAGVKDVEMHLCETGRHELLNEPERQQTMELIFDWIRGHCLKEDA